MALTATIFKASLDINDLRRHHYQNYPLTLARHPSETDERMMLRLLAFALFADEHLSFTRGLSNDEEPDLWQKSLSGEIDLWIELGAPSSKRLRRARGLAKQVVVLTYGGRTADQWWSANQAELISIKNLYVIEVEPKQSQALAALAHRNMELQCTIDEDGGIWLSDQNNNLEITPIERFGNLGGRI